MERHLNLNIRVRLTEPHHTRKIIRVRGENSANTVHCEPAVGRSKTLSAFATTTFVAATFWIIFSIRFTLAALRDNINAQAADGFALAVAVDDGAVSAWSSPMGRKSTVLPQYQ